VLVARDPLFPGEADAEYFDNVCRWLAEWFNVLPLDQAVDLLQQGTLPARAAAITFDDGYRDNHDVALPILRRHGLVATFFIATGYLDGGRMWNDTLIEAIRRAPAGRLDLSEQGFGVHELGDALSRRRAIDSLLPRIKYLDAPARQTAVDAIAGRAGASLPKDLMMTSAQVKALRREGMGIGGHTVSHPILAKLSDDAIAAELTDGRAALEDMVDAPVSRLRRAKGRLHSRRVHRLGRRPVERRSVPTAALHTLGPQPRVLCRPVAPQHRAGSSSLRPTVARIDL
jgi:peptidoglycan/xylan/chitin deacetylase (PgdA/CDA1 family)